jgi:hypothetical protein
MTEAGWGHTAILLLDGKVLVTGGYGSETDVTEVPNGEFVNPAASELYDPSNGTWTATGKMIETRALPTATLLPDGRVLVAGARRRSRQAATSIQLIWLPPNCTTPAAGPGPPPGR